MSVTVTFSCDGCSKTTPGTTYLGRRFRAFSGRGYGFGTWEHDKAGDVAPEGWVAFDPYTGACYCPDCWDGIVPVSIEDGATS